ncbi:hypothetical protein JW948_17355 [bacterium]|nr:hypothetical protein [bacterium]
MKCDMAPESLVSLLYADAEGEEEHKIRKHLEECEDCRRTFQELQETTEILGKWEDEIPALKTVFVQEPVSAWTSWKERLWGKPSNRLAWGLPVLVGAVLIFLFAFQFQAGYENGKWHVSFGKKGLSEKQLESRMETMLAEWQSRNTEQLVQLIQESETRQRMNFTMAINDYAQQQEMKRRQDLLLVGQGLEGLQRQTEGRYYQTSTLINDLIRMSNSPAPQP